MYLKAALFCKLFEDGSVKMYFVNKKHQTGEIGGALILLKLHVSWLQPGKDGLDLSDTGTLLGLQKKEMLLGRVESMKHSGNGS